MELFRYTKDITNFYQYNKFRSIYYLLIYIIVKQQDGRVNQCQPSSHHRDVMLDQLQAAVRRVWVLRRSKDRRKFRINQQQWSIICIRAQIVDQMYSSYATDDFDGIYSNNGHDIGQLCFDEPRIILGIWAVI